MIDESVPVCKSSLLTGSHFQLWRETASVGVCAGLITSLELDETVSGGVTLTDRKMTPAPSADAGGVQVQLNHGRRSPSEGFYHFL